LFSTCPSCQSCLPAASYGLGSCCYNEPLCPNAVTRTTLQNSPSSRSVLPASITSSARASSVGGTSRPSTLAVVRLISLGHDALPRRAKTLCRQNIAAPPVRQLLKNHILFCAAPMPNQKRRLPIMETLCSAGSDSEN